jgi:MSHA pilin protein MshA
MSKGLSIKKKLGNQRGFTLIEIIAVLVILAVLAVVAVPKYISMIDEARNSAAMSAIAEAQARAHLMASRMLLTSGALPSSVTIDTDVGDFTLSTGTISGTGTTVTASGNTGTKVAGGTASGIIRLPQS